MGTSRGVRVFPESAERNTSHDKMGKSAANMNAHRSIAALNRRIAISPLIVICLAAHRRVSDNTCNRVPGWPPFVRGSFWALCSAYSSNNYGSVTNPTSSDRARLTNVNPFVMQSLNCSAPNSLMNSLNHLLCALFSDKKEIINIIGGAQHVDPLI